jgi:hypothetical protein
MGGIRRHLVAVVAVILTSTWIPADAATPPTNDNFAAATLITMLPFTDATVSELLTPELDEPATCGGVHTAWYRFSPTTDTDVVFHSKTSRGFASIAVFEGDQIDYLTPLGCAEGQSDYEPALVGLLARAGHTYSIQLSQTAITAYAGSIVLNAVSGAEIRGRMTTVTGSGIAGCHASAWKADGLGNQRASATTAADGTYIIPSLLAGSFRVDFSCYPLYYDEAYDDTDYAHATNVTLATGEVKTGIDAELRRRGSYSGGARAPGGAPLADVCTYAYDSATGEFFGSYQRTGPDGLFVGAVSGTRTVNARLYDCSANRKYRPMWWPDAFDQAGSDGISIVEGEDTPGIDITLPLAVRPANDDRAAATVIDQLPFIDSTNTYLATAEPAEVQYSFTEIGPSCGTGPTVWYRYTAAESMHISLSSVGSDYQAGIAVFRSSSNADAAVPILPLASTCSHVAYYGKTVADLAVEAGETYMIQVAGPGELRLLVQHELPPANDARASAVVVSGNLPYSDSVRTFAASVQPGEDTSCGAMGGTVWYRLQVPSNRQVTVRTTGENAGEAAIAVYRETGLTTGAPALDAQPVACSSENYVPQASMAKFDAAANASYLIQIGGEGGFDGIFTVQITDVAAPANDNRADASPIGALPFVDQLDNQTASAEPGDEACGQMTHTVWYRYTATSAEHISVSTAGSTLVPALAVYRVTDAGAVPIACDTDSEAGGVRQPRADFFVTPGETYLFQAGSQASTVGQLHFEVNVETQPLNDMLANTQALSSSAIIRTYGATQERGELMPCAQGGPPGRTVWYRFEAPTAGRYQLSTIGSDFDTMAAVFTATDLPVEGPAGLLQVACNDDSAGGRNSFLEFEAAAGTTYFVQLGGWKFDAGVIHVSINQKPPA